MELEFTGQVVFEQLGLGIEIDKPASVQTERSWSIRKMFKSYRPDQMLNWQIPKSILPENHLAWFVRTLIAQLDLSEILSCYRTGDGRGQPPYDPGMLLALLTYSYCTERESARDIEQATYDDIACRIITGDQHPDYTTIANFRKRHLAALDNLFAQVLALAQEVGLVPLKNVAVDGTKVAANASKHKAMSYDRMCENEKKWESEIPQIKAQIDAAVTATSLPPSKLAELQKDLAIRQQRLPVIKANKAVLEEEAKEKVAKERRQHKETALQQGKKPRKRVWKTKPDAKAQRNFTDPDSKIMPSKKTFVQGYNAQVAVDGLAQIIVGKYVTQQTNDKQQLLPMARQIKARFGRLPDNILADSGFLQRSEPESRGMGRVGDNGFVHPARQRGKGQKSAGAGGTNFKECNRGRVDAPEVEDQGWTQHLSLTQEHC